MKRDLLVRPAIKPWVLLATLAIVLVCVSCNRVALDERFHNSSLSNWTVIDDPDTAEGPSKWQVEQDGWLHQRSNIWGRRGDFLGRWYGTFLVAGDTAWRDYTLSLKARPRDNDGFGVVFRYADPEHFYRLLFIEGDMNGGPISRLDKRFGGDYTELWSLARGYKPNIDMAIVIEVTGDRIQARVDGSILFEISDEEYDHGKVGLFCYAQNGQAFDEIRVMLK